MCPNNSNVKKQKFACVTSLVLCVTCKLLPTPTGTATDPPPANAATMNSRLVCQNRTQLLK